MKRSATSRCAALPRPAMPPWESRATGSIGTVTSTKVPGLALPIHQFTAKFLHPLPHSADAYSNSVGASFHHSVRNSLAVIAHGSLPPEYRLFTSVTQAARAPECRNTLVTAS